MYYESKSFYDRRKELKEAIRQLVHSTHPKVFATAVINDFSSPERARNLIKRFHKNVDYTFYGKNFYRVSKSKRTFFFAFPEKLNSNFHYHLLLTPPIGKTEHFIEIANPIWKKLCPAGNIKIDLINTEEDLRKVSFYTTKDCFIEQNFENFIISTEFCS
jgi:hypothetical protein